MNRRFERHLYAMYTEHVNAETTSIAQGTRIPSMGAAGAAPNKADPSWASSQRASASSHPPDEAPTHSIPRATLSEGANGGPAGAAGAAGAAPSQNALSILMVAVASAPAKIGAAAAKRCDKATAKPAKAERREGVSQKRPVSNMGAAGASSHTEAPADAGFASSEMPSRYEDDGPRVRYPGRPGAADAAPAPAPPPMRACPRTPVHPDDIDDSACLNTVCRPRLARRRKPMQPGPRPKPGLTA